MDILNKYEMISKNNIDSNIYISKFVESLDEKIEQIINLKYNKNMSYKLLHPIKMIRTNLEYNRLMTIKDDFKEKYNSSVLLYIQEETGYLEDDLDYASRVVKPKYMENYVKQIKLKNNKKMY